MLSNPPYLSPWYEWDISKRTLPFRNRVKRAPSLQQSNVAIFGDDNLKIGTNSLLFSITLPHASGDHIFFFTSLLLRNFTVDFLQMKCRRRYHDSWDWESFVVLKAVKTKGGGWRLILRTGNLWRNFRNSKDDFVNYDASPCRLIFVIIKYPHSSFYLKKRFSWNEMTLD